MYKIFIHLICFFIFNKKKRKSFRKKMLAYPEYLRQCKKMKSFGDYLPIKKFKYYYIKRKSILIVEFNDFHGITLPGYIHYFKELGYNVDLFLRYGQNLDEYPLERVTDTYTAFFGDEKTLKKALKKEKIKRYDFVFLNTTFYYGILGYGISVFDILGFVPSGKFGTLMIEHNISPYVEKFGEEKYIQDGTLFTLLGFRGTKMLSSSYVGKVNIKQKSPEKIVFLSVGTIYKGSRNYEILFKTCQELISLGIKNFEVNIIGQGSLRDLPPELGSYVHVLGRLNYPDMYKAVENADYMLTLFDPEIEEHHKYLDNWASGTSILIYAFCKPCLIHQFFAEAYFLNDENAILYDDALFDAMKCALSLSDDDYAKMQKNLSTLSENLQTQSEINLKEQMERMKNENHL